jgi:hypothetical protein
LSEHEPGPAFPAASRSSATKRVGAVAGIAAIALLVAWVGAYAVGAFPWIGYAWLERSSHGLGPITIIGETRVGTEFGFDDFLFFKGQEVVIAYDADIRAGSLWFHVFNLYDGVLGDGRYHYVSESGRGEWTVPIARTGLYHITVDPSPVRGKGRGWDLTYTAWWGARPAGR